MIFVDTGYLIALGTPNDACHKRATAWSDAIEEPLLVTEYVLWEVVNFFSYPSGRLTAHTIVDTVESDTEYTLVGATSRLFQAGLQLHQERPDKEWSLTDCISFTVMREHGIDQALAYDHHFEQAGFEALLRRDPAP